MEFKTIISESIENQISQVGRIRIPQSGLGHLQEYQGSPHSNSVRGSKGEKARTDRVARRWRILETVLFLMISWVDLTY